MAALAQLGFWLTTGMAGAVLGCGSNVLDRLVRVRWLPTAAWSKTLSIGSTKELAGGVVFNQLAWAASFGVPVRLLAAQPPISQCGRTKFFREEMRRHNVGEQHVVESVDHVLGESQVFVHRETADRYIVMQPGSTRDVVTPDFVERHWGSAVASSSAHQGPKIVIAEISQLQLAAVEKLADFAAVGPTPKPFFLDIDLEPLDQAFKALDGDMGVLLRILSKTSLVKISKNGLCEVLRKLNVEETSPDSLNLDGIAQRSLSNFIHATGCKVAALTRGSSNMPVLACQGPPPSVVTIQRRPTAMKLRNVAIDSTGAGDAFMGGLIAHAWEAGLPTNHDTLHEAGLFAEAAARHCCTIEGALPHRIGHDERRP